MGFNWQFNCKNMVAPIGKSLPPQTHLRFWRKPGDQPEFDHDGYDWVHHANKNIWHMCLSEIDGKTLNALINHHVVHLDCHSGVTVYHFATCLGAPYSPAKMWMGKCCFHD